MNEAVRLVIWDLDETFWKGTLTEGGITEYVQAHHDLIIELAKRGIMSSICSKNDYAQVSEILGKMGIFEYFIFPSVSWDPKGVRLARLIETVQLRAPTVMFIDDNPNNRAEAVALVPGLQTEDETFIGRMLSDPRFKGKPDPELTRLKQYKLLEERKRDEESVAGSNEDFLRGCDIRVFIDYNVAQNIDRAIELINRTNQLNYTKKRLPEDIVEARKILLSSLDEFNHQSGLIRVTDRYGDYGFVGFFSMVAGRKTLSLGEADAYLEHFCFSCRTLGMLIEQWVYEHLRRPELHVVGEVLTDLTIPRQIDWVTQVSGFERGASALAPLASEIVITGGCEANAVGVYLGSRTNTVSVLGNFEANGLFVHLNSAVLLEDLCRRSIGEFKSEAAVFGVPPELMAGDVFVGRPPGTCFVVNVSRESEPQAVYMHKYRGWKLWLQIWGLEGLLMPQSEGDLIHRAGMLAERSPSKKDLVFRLMRHFRNNYVLGQIDQKDGIEAIEKLIKRTPIGGKLVLALNHHKLRGPDNQIVARKRLLEYTERVRGLARNYPFVDVVSFSEVIRDDSEIQIGVNHYHREVFLRFSDRVTEVLSGLIGKEAA